MLNLAILDLLQTTAGANVSHTGTNVSHTGTSVLGPLTLTEFDHVYGSVFYMGSLYPFKQVPMCA